MSSPNAHLATADPELAPLLAKISGRPAPVTDDVLVLRKQFELVSSLHQTEWEHRRPPASACRVKEQQIEVDGRDGKTETIPVKYYVPTPPNFTGQEFPLFVWYHGGGFVAGTLRHDDTYLRTLCVDLQVSIVSVGYRLAPEHPFPTGFNDAYAGLKWAATHTSMLNASPEKGFVVGGTSAGANLSAAVALRARDDPFFAPGSGRELTGQMLQTPQVIHPEASPGRFAPELRSMEEQANAPFLTARKVLAFTRALRAPPDDPRASPLLAPSHAGLPRAFVQVFGLDPLRDEGLAYARVLREAGVETQVKTYVGAPHTFDLVFPDSKLAIRVLREFSEGLRWLLGRPSP
ncbi:Alpha/Beta hydrolase protein [Trametes elegans]|nr:Alpha/Beta hydrolase protein [Trametes elegans]